MEYEATKRVTADNPVALAIKMCDSGADLARRIGVSRSEVWFWSQREWFPDKYLKDVSKATGIPVKHLMTPKNGKER